jgi:uncharacterized protein
MMHARGWQYPITVLFLFLLLGHAAEARGAQQEQLLEAVRAGDVAEVEGLLERGANPDVASRQAPYAGKTALMWAADLGYGAVVESLLRHGAAVDTRHPKGSTALMYAVLRDQPDTVELLLRAGADPNLRVRHGWTPVLLATVKGQDRNVRVLAQYGAEFGVQDIYGWTPLMRAAERGDIGLVELLLELGCDPGQREHSGMTALDISRALGHREVAQALSQAQAQR